MPNLKCGTILFHLSGRKSSAVFLKIRVEDRAFVAMIMFVILIAEIFMFEKYLCQSREAVNAHNAFLYNGNYTDNPFWEKA